MERLYEIPEGDDLKRIIRNPREEAIYDVLGGINSAAEKLGVRRQSVHYLLTQPRIREVDTAKHLSEVTARAGRAVPIAELLDLEPWRGPERHGSDPMGRKRRGPNGSSPRANLTAVKPSTGAGSDVGAGSVASATPRKGKHKQRKPSSAAGSQPAHGRTFAPDFYDAERIAA